MKHLGQRGDTIVEVLLAILVVSTILGGAFVSARRSQTGIRQTQERVEALKVAEAQIERIRAVAKSGATSPVFVSPSTFCLADDNTKKIASLTPLAADDFTHTQCSSIPSGVTFYTVAQRAAGNTFTVYTRWDGIGGSGKQEVQLSARIDP